MARAVGPSALQASEPDGNVPVLPVAGPFASTREQIIVAAETLFALGGLEGVSLQQVRVVAGQANRSAVQYHFGSKEGLVRAILEYRLPRLAKRRAILLAEAELTGRLGDMRALVEALVVPLAEEAEYGDGRYAGFLCQLGYYGWSKEQFRALPGELTDPMFRSADLLRETLGGVPAPLVEHRVNMACTMFPAVIAEREYMLRAGHTEGLLPFPLFMADLIDFLCDALQGSPSTATVAMLAASQSLRG